MNLFSGKIYINKNIKKRFFLLKSLHRNYKNNNKKIQATTKQTPILQ